MEPNSVRPPGALVGFVGQPSAVTDTPLSVDVMPCVRKHCGGTVMYVHTPPLKPVCFCSRDDRHRYDPGHESVVAAIAKHLAR